MVDTFGLTDGEGKEISASSPPNPELSTGWRFAWASTALMKEVGLLILSASFPNAGKR